MYNQVILYYVLPYVQQKKNKINHDKNKQEVLVKTYAMWAYKKFHNLDLNEKRDGADTIWYGSSFHIKGQFKKKEYLKTVHQPSKIMGPSKSSSSEA